MTNRSPHPLRQIDRPLAVQPVAAVKVQGARPIFIYVRLILFDIPLSIFYYIQYVQHSVLFANIRYSIRFDIRFYSMFGFVRYSIVFDFRLGCCTVIFIIFRPPHFSQPNNPRFCVKSTRLVAAATEVPGE